MSAPRPAARRLLVALAGLALAALAILLFTAWRGPMLALFTQRERLQALIAHLGPLGPLGLIALQAAQVVLAPIPGQALGLVGGYLYGVWLGTLYSMLGLTAGTCFAVWLVRRWGRPLIERLLDRETLARVDRISGRLGVPLLFLVFLVPFLPDDAILLVAGLAGMPLSGILMAALLGRLPGVFVSAWVGASAGAFSPAQWAAAVAATLAVAIPLYRWRGELARAMWSLIERVAPGHSSSHRPRER